MNRPAISQPTPVHEHPLTFLGELVADAVRALSVPRRHGRWDLHRWEATR